MLIQTHKTALRPLTTAHLAQTMSLLELSGEELRQKLDSALASNPALELADEPRCPSCHRRLQNSRPCPNCSAPIIQTDHEPIVFVSPSSDFGGFNRDFGDQNSPSEEWTAAEEDLPTYVLRQIAPDLNPQDRSIAAHILTSLDEDGLLRTPPIEIARYHHIPISRVEKVIHIIQRADPIGVGSTTPQDALLAQLAVLSETQDVPPLTDRAIRDGMRLLSRRAHSELGRLLGISQAEACKIATFLSENLNPYPARAHWGEPHSTKEHPQVYKRPDMIIRFQHHDPEGALVVEIISPYAGSLRINPLFRNSLSEAPKDKLDQWQAEMESAALLIKCLQQRDHTLVRLMRRLVSVQRNFILNGETELIPITRAHLADELEVHESTISRAVSGKTTQLPNKRIIPLSMMFDRSLPLRTIIKQIIAKEVKPLSDQQLTEILQKQGYSVARRTVAKYRAMEGILPARLRNHPSVSLPT